MKSELKIPSSYPVNASLNNSDEQGAVLVIGLVILTIMSLITVSGMNAALVNEKMAANHQYKEASFQSADSGGDYALQQDEWVNTTLGQLDQPEPDWPSYVVDLEDGHSTVSVNMQARRAPVSGNSVRLGGTFNYYIIETEATADSHESAVNTVITKGFARAGAG